MLRIKDLTYEYENSQFHFDFSAKRGEITAIVGQSGAGKSTLLSLIAGFLKPLSGDILLSEVSLLDKEPHKRDLSILFQENNLFTHLSIFDNIALGINPKLKLRQDDKKNIEEVASTLGIKELLYRLPTKISGGQKQRVALCRAILRDKPLLLLDEPFSALDKELREEMLDEIAKLSEKNNTIVLMITHNIEDAKRVAKKTIKIENGRSREIEIF